MEYTWDKKRIGKLLNADSEVTNDFGGRFIPILYTWMHYQVGADADIATELTEETLNRAIEQISQFQPRQQTFYHWLKEIAKQVRDEGLAQRHMKPQRPWAWFQLPETVLHPLSLLRQESLPEATCTNTFVQEIVQATLAEMDFVDRELMMHRYSHLDTPVHIANEMKIPQEEIENRLYRCRHSFKRIFTHLVSTTNNGFSESNAPAETEVLDGNLERLLSATEMNLAVPQKSLERLNEAVTQAVQRVSASMPSGANVSRNFLIAGILGMIVIAAITAALLLKSNKPQEIAAPPPETKKDTVPEKVTPAADKAALTQNEIDDEEVNRVIEIGNKGDIDALLEILKSGQYPSQVVAAYFLGQLADPGAIDPLKNAEEQWYPDGPEDNPFAEAINAIAARYPEEVEIVEETPEPVEEVKPDIPQQQPTVWGTVRDFTNAPVKGASLHLIKTLTDITAAGSQRLGQGQTQSNGEYRFTLDYEGHAYLRAVISNDGPAKTITKSIWCQSDSAAQIDFGGKTSFIGQVTVDSRPSANQTLYLIDSADPAMAAYGQQTQTDNEGNFEFWGVSPGNYTLFNEGLDKHLYRLSQVQMPDRETYITNIRIVPVKVFVPLPSEPNEAWVDVELLYAQNASGKMNRYKGSPTEDGQILFDNIAPGSYLMRMQDSNGTWFQQAIDVVDGIAEQVIEPEPTVPADVVLSGQFLKASPIDLFLTNVNQNVHLNLQPEGDGYYEAVLPADVYQLAAYIHGEFVELTQIDLQEEMEFTLDIDPDELLTPLSPLYVIVADRTGTVLSGAQIILAGQDSVTTALSSGRGAFLAVEPGSYQLTVIVPGLESITREIQVAPGDLQAPSNGKNTLYIQLNPEK